MSFVNVFGGTTIYPADVAYRDLPLTANTTLEWPTELASSANILASIMDVTPAGGTHTIRLPAANLASVGETALFFNVGAVNFIIADNGGNTLVTVAPGLAWQVYLTNNVTANGVWRSTQYGAGTSSATAGSLVGAGIKAIGTTLNQSMPSTSLNTNYTVGVGDRAQVLNWTGGAGTFTLPSAATAGADWFFNVRNSGTGSVTISPSVGGQFINGGASLVMNPGDSAVIFCDSAGFFTVGLGKSAAFAFDFVSIDLTGQPSPYTLSGANLNRIAYRFTGTITGNMEVVAPATVQQYWFANETSLASAPYMITLKTAAGSGVNLSRNQRAIVYCDGTNVVDADTGGISIPLTIAQGGTGATTESGARINLGGTSTGIAVFTAASASSARNSLGSGATGDAIFVAANTAAAQAALGTITVPNGGTGATTLTGVVKGNGTSAFTAGTVSLTSEVSGTLPVANGGTGQTTYTNGQLLIGNTTGNTLTKATLTAGTNISITNGAGAITINATDQFVGTVTSVSGTGTVSGITLTGTVTTSGSLTLGGTLAVTPSNFASQTANTFLAAPNGAPGVPTFRAIVAADVPTLNQNTTGTAANVTGIVAVANGGTGATTAGAARTSLGATTVGANVFTLTDPSAITFPRFNADNTVSALDAASFRTAIGAGTGAGSVTSVSGTGTVNGITLTGTVTSSGSLTLGGTLSGVDLATQTIGTLAVARGGTGLTSTPANGALDIGNGTGFTRATLTAGSGVSITNGAGSITIAATGSGGTVTSVNASGGTTGMTFSGGPITGSGTLTLAGTLAVANGGTGVTSSTGTGSVVLSASPSFTGTTSFGPAIITGTGASTGDVTIEVGGNRTGTGNAFIDLHAVAGTDFEARVIRFAGANGIMEINNTGTGGMLLNNSGAAAMAFQTAATERMRIDSSGNVGIGTSSPSQKLDVTTSGGDDGIVLVNSSASGGRIRLDSTGTGGRSYHLNSTANGSGDGGGKFVIRDSTASDAARFVIDSSGNVGIGTSTPGVKLDVAGTIRSTGTSVGRATLEPGGASNSGFTGYYNSAGTRVGYIGFANDSSGIFLINSEVATNAMTFSTAATERMRITSAGNVGIGTSSPDANTKLDVSSSSFNIVASRSTTSFAAFQRFSPAGQQAYDFYTINGVEVARITADGANLLAFSTGSAATERMRIDSTGNVGIGTTTPAQKLDIRGGDLQVSRGAAGVAADAAINFGSNANNYIFSGNSNNLMAFATNGSERMRITSTGNVGIGDPTPAAKLRIVGTSGTSQFGAGTSGNAVFINAFDSNPIYMTASATNSTAFGFGAASNIPLFLMTNNTERMRIDSSGNVGIGTSSPGVRFDVTGQGRLGNGVAQASPSATDIASTSHTILGGQGGNALFVGQYPTTFASWIQSSFTNPTTATYNIVLQPLGGNVGIGTATPAQRLHVRQDQDGTTAALIQNRNGSGTPISAVQFISGAFDLSDNRYAMISSAGGSNTTLQFWTGQGTTPTERMRIDSAGKVGIGTSSPDPSAALDVSSTTAGFLPPRMNTAARDLINGGSPADGLVIYNVTTEKLQVYVSPSWINLH